MGALSVLHHYLFSRLKVQQANSAAIYDAHGNALTLLMGLSNNLWSEAHLLHLLSQLVRQKQCHNLLKFFCDVLHIYLLQPDRHTAIYALCPFLLHFVWNGRWSPSANGAGPAPQLASVPICIGHTHGFEVLQMLTFAEMAAPALSAGLSATRIALML